MVIKIYISGNSGNKEIVTHQQRIFMILKSLSIEFSPVDIAAPGMESERDFMRQNANKKDGQRNALPPQIFNGEKYCGDYEAFDLANEDDELEEFLGIPRITPKSTPAFAKAGNADAGGDAAPVNGHCDPASEEQQQQQATEESPADATAAADATAEEAPPATSAASTSEAAPEAAEAAAEAAETAEEMAAEEEEEAEGEEEAEYEEYEEEEEEEEE